MESEIDCTVCLAVDASGHGRRFLDSLFRTADPVSTEVIVINTGPENELDILEKEFPSIIIFENNIRENRAKTRNRVFPLARGRYISFWQDEIILQRGCLFRLINFLDDNPAVGIAAPLLVNIDDQPLVSGGRFPSLFSWLLAGGRLPVSVKKTSQSAAQPETGWLCGAALVINPVMTEETGLFDPRFPCWEEIDLCFRARRIGWHINLVPEARAVYRYPAWQQDKQSLSREFAAGLRFFQKKWLGSIKK